MLLLTERLTLTLTDASMLQEILAYFKRNRNFHGRYQPKNEESFYREQTMRNVIGRYLQDSGSGTGYRFWITAGEEETVIGVVSLNDIIRGPFQSGYLGYSLDEAYQGRGYAAEAVKRVIDFAFGHLRLHRLEAYISLKNQPSVKLAERLHFRREGIARSYLNVDGAWEDHLCMALICGEENG